MPSINKKPFSQSIRMEDSYKVVNSLGLRAYFAKHENIVIAGDASRNCTTWFPVDKELFFKWVERRTDIFKYQYVVEETFTDIASCVRIHAVERTRKNSDV